MMQLVAQLGIGVREDRFVSADDLGLNRGDGCFDATLVRVDGSRPTADFVDLHLERLSRSARILSMPPPDLDAWRGLLGEALAGWQERGGGEAVAKLLYTRGLESRPTEPLCLVTITELSAQRIAERSRTTAVTLCAGRAVDALNDAPWLLGGAKTLSYAVNLAYAREAARRGVQDAILVSTDGYVLEGPKSGIIVLRAGTLLSTPPQTTGILESITVRLALDGWERSGGRSAYGLFTPEDLRTADAVWLASSVRGITPVVTLNGEELPRNPEITAQLVNLVRP